MMKKKLLFTLLFAAQIAFAQIISKDNTFASNGIHTMTGNLTWAMVQDSNGGIYYTRNQNTYPGLNVTESSLSKLTSSGVLDSTFGNNGTVLIPNNSYLNQIKIQSDGKLLVFGIINSGNVAISRIFPSGQLDTTFGTGGTSIIPVGENYNYTSFGIVLQNDKIIVHGMALVPNTPTYKHTLYRLNTNGSIDPTFGNNSSVTTQGNQMSRAFVLTDSQSNIVVLNSYTGTIEKFNPNGQPITSFGNNGVLQTSFSSEVDVAIMDSSNKIVYSNQNHEIFRINPDGTFDNTFNYDFNAYTGTHPIILSIVEKNGTYFIGGESNDPSVANTFIISKLAQNGLVDSSFGYFSDSNTVGDMIVNDNNIITIGSIGLIMKYLLNNASLSTTDITKINHDIVFENPVTQNLIFKTKENVSTIEIYSLDGKLVRTLKDNNTDVSELAEGIYIVKVKFENGKTTTKKLIKK